VAFKDEDIEITGVVGNTLCAEDTRKNQIIFLNNRNIKDKLLEKGADQAFVASIGIGKKGFYILNIKMPAYSYDVNVHPTKMEVRFKEEDKVYKAVYNAIKTSLLNKDFLGNKQLEAEVKKDEYIKNEFDFLTNHFNLGSSGKENFYESTSDIDNLNENRKESEIEENKKVHQISSIKNTVSYNGNSDTYSEKLKTDLELITRENERKIEYKFCGILFKTYIVIEIDNQMYLIDQHAGHERILYEQIRANYKDNLKNNTQMVLLPELIELSHKEMDFVKENIELFFNIGFDIDFFGDTTLKISGFPDIEYREKINNREMFMDILDEMIGNSRSNFKTVEERFIATVACKAAVKAGMDLTATEVDKLIQRLLKLQNPYTCPHGRPTTIKFSKEELFGVNFLTQN
jgi:DNA mismatch repair protein MutL